MRKKKEEEKKSEETGRIRNLMWSEDKRAKQRVDLLQPTSFLFASNQPTALYLHFIS
jgi:hypothetical protein